MRITFNKPPVTGRELEYISDVIASRQLSGNGRYTKLCQEWLKQEIGASDVLLTQSCTSALEMAAILCDLQPGDEVIMPSFTFVSTANAVVLAGATPVFVDIRSDTLNIDETLIEAAITKKTKAIFVVHYAGVPAEMDSIMRIAHAHGLLVVEDAAQALTSRYKNKPAGSLGHMSCFSFHETKNIVSGEGGAIALNRPELVDRARVIWEKGTNRRKFLEGAVDKYTWVDKGSSFLPSELTAAYLWAQLQESGAICSARLSSWSRYHAAFSALSDKNNLIRLPTVPTEVKHNGHLYYMLAPDADFRGEMIRALDQAGVSAHFHYIPLHSSPAGLKYGRSHGDLPVTDLISGRLVRLPLWYDMGNSVDIVVAALKSVLKI